MGCIERWLVVVDRKPKHDEESDKLILCQERHLKAVLALRSCTLWIGAVKDPNEQPALLFPFWDSRIPLPQQINKREHHVVTMEQEPADQGESSNIRFSNSPRRWTQVIEALTSPVKSVHPEQSVQMDSLNSQTEFGHRTTDFFDDSSDDEAHTAVGTAVTSPDIDGVERPRSRSPPRRKEPPPSAQNLREQCEPKRVALQHNSDGYQRLESNLTEHVPVEDDDFSPETSFHGSVDEIFDHAAKDGPAPLRPARLSSGRTASSGTWRHDQEYNKPNRLSGQSDKIDQRLGVHAVAHDFLLRGLLADQEVMRRDKSSALRGSRPSEIRHSALPPQLRMFDPRSPRDQIYSAPGLAGSTSSVGKPSKKVHVVPPPLDVDSTKRKLPADLVRTPYPHTHKNVHRKSLGIESPDDVETPGPATTESILTLSIRKCNPNSRAGVTSITIPASNDYSAVRTSGQRDKEDHFRAHDFDDAELFREVRKAYKRLSGAWRVLSARKLKRIVVSSPAQHSTGGGHGWLHQPRSPRELAYRGLTDTFGEDQIMAAYRRPESVKGQHAFVHWTHRLADAPNTPASPDHDEQGNDGGLVRRREQPEGLEFVVSWSMGRILAVLAAVILLSIAAILLWTFLGRPGGTAEAGGRVAGAVLIGICIFLIGCSGVAGWLGVSWLVM